MYKNTFVKIDKHIVSAGLIITGLISAVFILYWPSLPGPFIFDDFQNLIPLGRYPELDLLQRVLVYITHEGESLIYRPISFLSFYINDNTWPSTPYGFRYTNIAIHSINTLLVFWLSLKIITLSSYKNSQTNTLFLSFCVALIWGIHPIQVNAVAYIVQRMTLLSGMFTLSGLILYVCGREKLFNNNNRSGLIQMSLSILVFMPLAFLSKETGVLLPLFIFVLEFTLFNTLKGHKSAMRWSVFFVLIPTLIAVIGIIVKVKGNFNEAYDALNYGPVERLLSQSRILWDYMRSILIPMARTSSLFHENYLISTSLFEPITTLFSVVAWLSSFVVAVMVRHRWPIISFAILWFIAGHLLESSVIGLEIYFEHRNYIPSVAILFAFIVGMHHLLRGKQKTFVLLIMVYAGLLAFVTYINTSKWSSAFELETSWYRSNPDSIRSTKGIIGILVTVGEYDKAKEIILAQQKRWPKNPELPLLILLLDCYTGNLDDSSITTFMNNLATDYWHSNTLHKTLEELYRGINDGTCPTLKLSDLQLIDERLLKHPKIVSGKMSEKWGFVARELYFYLQLIAREEGNVDKAIVAFERGNALWPTPRLMMDQIEWLISVGLYKEAQDVTHRIIALMEKKTINDYLNPRHKKITRYVNQLQQVIEQKQASDNLKSIK